MIQYYAPDIETTLQLEEAEAIHCARVLRCKPGDTIFVTDGRGHRFECVITEATPKRVRVRIERKISVESNRKSEIVLAVAPTKNVDRMEWLVEKCVELGIDRIILLKCDRSERKVMKTERLRKIMVSAMNQSLQCRLPELTELTKVSDVATMDFNGDRYIAHCESDRKRKEFATVYSPDKGMLMMIGPEGDFSPQEIENVLSAGFIPVMLGATRLRTETAALYSVTSAHTLQQRCSG